MWITPSQSEVQASLLAPYELNLLQAQQGSGGVMAQVMSRVANMIQGSVRAGKYLPGGVIPAGYAGTIPDELAEDFIALVRWRVLEAFPNLKYMQTQVRSDANKTAEAKLERVRNHDYAIQPPVPTSGQGAPGAFLSGSVVPGRMCPSYSGGTREQIRSGGNASGAAQATQAVTSGSVVPNGNVAGNIGDLYSQIVNGVLLKLWAKTTGNGTNTGWT